MRVSDPFNEREDMVYDGDEERFLLLAVNGPAKLNPHYRERGTIILGEIVKWHWPN